MGTRGDVQPLLALSIALQDSPLDCRVTLITHGAHRVSLRCMLHFVPLLASAVAHPTA